MDLLQEYYERHQIKEVPLIRYVDRDYLLLRSKEGDNRITALYITYSAKPETSPGTFRFGVQHPTYDAGSNQVNPLRSTWEKKLEWDEWESFVAAWSEASRGHVVPLTGDEADLAVWEVFAYCHDTWLSQNLPPRLIDKLFVVLDRDAPGADRKAAAAELEAFLKARPVNKPAASLAGLMSNYGAADNQAAWLAKLLV